MPTTRPRYQITETPEVAHALELAARRWPGESRSKLMLHLIRTGGAALEAQHGQAERQQREAIDSSAGKYAEAFGEHHLDELRQEWPA